MNNIDANTTTLLLELYTEETPARFQAEACAQLQRRLSKALQEASLVGQNKVQVAVSCYRLVAWVNCLNVRQARTEELNPIKGPRVGAHEQAILGFFRKVGLGDLLYEDALRRCEVENGVYVYRGKTHERLDAMDILPNLLADVLGCFTWPQSMRWDDSGLRWVRPLRGIVCLLGDGFQDKVVPLPFPWCNLQEGIGKAERDGKRQDGKPVNPGRTTLGIGVHVQATPPFLDVPAQGHSAQANQGYKQDAYKHWMRDQGIIIDARERKQSIENQLQEACARLNVLLHHDEALLDEVIGLCESPKVYVGAIPERYLALPGYVITTVLRNHQKYFMASDEDRRTAPYFFFVSPLDPPDGGKLMIQGNERVMCARLEDALFLEAQDRSVHEELPYAQSWEHKLKDMTWYLGLGDYALKTRRLEHIAVALARHLGWDEPRLAQLKEAARLSKVDLVSQMVGEFPELQGKMGAHYARCAGVDGQIAEAIAQHYRPLGWGDVVPSGDLGKVLALADKLDLIWTVFLSGDYPTGSRDPLGVRRAYLGMVRILWGMYEQWQSDQRSEHENNPALLPHIVWWKCAQEAYELQGAVMPSDAMHKLSIYTRQVLARKNLPSWFCGALVYNILVFE